MEANRYDLTESQAKPRNMNQKGETVISLNKSHLLSKKSVLNTF